MNDFPAGLAPTQEELVGAVGNRQGRETRPAQAQESPSEDIMAGAQIGQGDVPITIDGEDRVLRPTFMAAQMLSRREGGLIALIDRVMRLDMDVILQVVSLGLGYGPSQKAPKDLAEKIWKSGFTDDTGGVAEACIRYLRVLAAGGRPVSMDPTEDAGDREDTDPQRP